MNKDLFANTSDNELLEKFYTSGNNEYLGALLQRYTLLLFGVCMKYLKREDEAKDAVQQIFLKVITELNKYRVEYFKSWLYMVTRNHCLMQLRDKQGRNMKEINESFPLSEEQPATEKHIEKEKLLTVLEACLEDLNTEQKTCVTLFYLQKKSYTQITEITGYSLLQVKSFIQNGKRNLKNLAEKKLKAR